MPARDFTSDLGGSEVADMTIAAGTQFLCDCGAEVLFIRPCQVEDAAAPTCACGAEMYAASVDDEEREFALVR